MKNKYTPIYLLLLTTGTLLSVNGNAQTLNYLPKWYPNTSTFNNSLLYDDGSNVGMGTDNPTVRFDVQHSTTSVIKAGITSGSSNSYASFMAHDITNNKSLVQMMGGGAMSGTLFGVNRAGSGQLYTNSAPLVIGTVQAYDITFGTNNTGRMIIKSNGYVGINTTSPASLFDIQGGNSTHFIFNPTSSTSGYSANFVMDDTGLKIGHNSGYRDFEFQTANTTRMTIDAAGNVGIGTLLTNNPNNYKLAVNGTIGAKAVKVENNSATWPDFVFDADYNLMDLQELTNYLVEHKHLPQIPTAKEIEQNGVDVGEMLRLQMQKIEELTLYIIEQNKRIEKLEGKEGK